MKKTKEEAQQTREEVLSAGLRVFSQKGFSATRLEDIAKEAGVTRGAIYHHFGSKENLYKTLVLERSQGINQLAEQILSEDRPPGAKLKTFVTRLFKYGVDNQEYRALLELSLMKVEHVDGLAELIDQTIAGRRTLTRLLQGLAEEASKSGEFRADLDPSAVAVALLGFINGIGLLWVQDPDGFSLGERADELTEVLFQGLES